MLPYLLLNNCHVLIFNAAIGLLIIQYLDVVIDVCCLEGCCWHILACIGELSGSVALSDAAIFKSAFIYMNVHIL